MTRRTLAGLAVVLFLLAATGCGSTSSPTSFHAKANEICARYKEKQNALPASANERETVRLLRAELRELRGLKPPMSKAQTYHRWLSAIDALARLLDHQRVVLARDEALVSAALKREKAPNWKPTPEELKHPTEAILARTLEPLPEWHAFVRHSNAIMRQGTVRGRRVLLFGRPLGLLRCMT